VTPSGVGPRDLLACSPVPQPSAPTRDSLKSTQNKQITVRAEGGIILMLNLVQKLVTGLCGVEVYRKQRAEMPVEVLNLY